MGEVSQGTADAYHTLKRKVYSICFWKAERLPINTRISDEHLPQTSHL